MTKIGKVDIRVIVEAYASGKTLREVGEQVGVSRERVRQRLEEAGYQRRKYTSSVLNVLGAKRRGKKVDQTLPKADLEQLYNRERLSIPQIAKIKGISTHAVWLRLVKHNIPRRQKRDYGDNQNIATEDLKRMYLGDGMTAAEVAARFGVSKASMKILLSRRRILKKPKS